MSLRIFLRALMNAHTSDWEIKERMGTEKSAAMITEDAH